MDSHCIYISIAGYTIKVIFEHLKEKDKRYEYFRKGIWLQYRHYIIKHPKVIYGQIHVINQEPFVPIYVNKSNAISYLPYCEEIDKFTFITYYHISTIAFKQLYFKLLDRIITQNEGIFLHASGVVRNNEAELFLAPSGGGKSTLASIFKRKINSIADDSVLIKKVGDVYKAFVLPDIDSYTLKIRLQKLTENSFPIKRIYILCKSKSWSMDKIDDTVRVQSLILKQLLAQNETRRKQSVKALQFAENYINQTFLLQFPLNGNEKQFIEATSI